MRLSILQMASGFPGWGGTELHILNLSAELKRRGHDVTIACRPGRWVEERARQMGLATVPISMMRQQDMRDYARLRAYMKKNSPNVMHVHWSLDMLVPGFAALAEQIPVRVVSRHMPYPFKTRLGTFIYSRMLFTRFITVSNSVRNVLVGCGVSPEKVEVIHHGTDVAAFERITVSAGFIRRELGVPDGCLAVGIVGRVAPEKGHKVLLEAAKKLQGDAARYVVIGNGPDDELIRRTAKALGIEDRVIFAGFRDDVNNAINAMDVVTVPSMWDEPCSAVVQQAMALSKPVVGTRTGGTPEMIVDNETGLLVPPGDAVALAVAIARLAGDPALREGYGRAGRERVESHFSLAAMTDKIETLYCREYALSRRGSAFPIVAES